MELVKECLKRAESWEDLASVDHPAGIPTQGLFTT